jgi:hypothetical protein
MGILEKLRGRKTSKDLHEAVEGIRAEIANTQARLTELRAKLGPALFDSTAEDVSALRRDIAAAEDLLGTLELTEAEAQSRLEAAQRSETEANLKRSREMALGVRAELRKAAAEYDKHIEELIAVGDRMRELSSSIAQTNAILETAGFGHLRVPAPIFGYEIGRSEHVAHLRSRSPSRSFDALEASGRL